jgi:hypothetical protein
MPDDIDEKTGDSVATVLESTHPDARVPDLSFSLPTSIHQNSWISISPRTMLKRLPDDSPEALDLAEWMHMHYPTGCSNSEQPAAGSE